jgi:hypothetical protein
MKLLSLLFFSIFVLCSFAHNGEIHEKPSFETPKGTQSYEFNSKPAPQFKSKPASEFISKIEVPKEKTSTSSTTQNKRTCSTQPVCLEFKKVYLESGKETMACKEWKDEMVCASVEDEKKPKQAEKKNEFEDFNFEPYHAPPTSNYQTPKQNQPNSFKKNLFERDDSFDRMPSSNLYSPRNNRFSNHDDFEFQQRDVDNMRMDDSYFD